MIPILQTEFEVGKGNCLSACVASILNLPLEEVPNFRLGVEQWEDLQKWLYRKGLCAIRFPAEADCLWSLPYGAYCILVGNSPRSENVYHSVVGRVEGRVWTLVHDPHPSRDGLNGKPIWITFLCVCL